MNNKRLSLPQIGQFVNRTNVAVITSAILLVILILFSGAVSITTLGNVIPRENKVTTAVNQLSFLSDSEKQSLTLSIMKAAQNGLLNFSSSVGTNALLNALNQVGGSPSRKSQVIRLYQTTLQDNLPVFLLTKTSIRLLRRGAPLQTVLATARKEINVLHRVNSFLQQEGVTLYLTYQNRSVLIDTLAESIEIYSRQQNDNSGQSIEDKLNQLQQTTYRLINVSSLPVSVGTNSGGRTSSNNAQLSQFLAKRQTIHKLLQIAQTINW